MVHESRGSSQDVGGECSAEQMDVILGYLSQPSKRVLHRRSLRSLSHSSDVLERRFVDSRHDLQLGSRPPPCHSQCARCEDGVCIARPVYSRGSSGAAQHAIWTCSCLH
ncbi:hypothetical protein KP509_07G085200 [Ceratopteris richardii]|nr:hypothetical protein KP509_07G085200 [Ceratopteris richardii]